MLVEQVKNRMCRRSPFRLMLGMMLIVAIASAVGDARVDPSAVREHVEAPVQMAAGGMLVPRRVRLIIGFHQTLSA